MIHPALLNEPRPPTEPPPEGYEVVGRGPLMEPYIYPMNHLAVWDAHHERWFVGSLNGNQPLIYAAKVGTAVHALNTKTTRP